jgi:hypothetical protein
MFYLDFRRQVIDLEKKIGDLDAKIKDSQQFWLRLQSNVVTLSEKRAQQMDEIFIGRKREFTSNCFGNLAQPFLFTFHRTHGR